VNLKEKFKDFSIGLLIGVEDDLDGFRMPFMVSEVELANSPPV